jgi:hypothetical protein
VALLTREDQSDGDHEREATECDGDGDQSKGWLSRPSQLRCRGGPSSHGIALVDDWGFRRHVNDSASRSGRCQRWRIRVSGA